MKTAFTVTGLLGAMLFCTAPAQAADKTARIVAYINQSSGCQRPTEALLKDLDKTYGDRLSVEFVDFGQPEGRKRWLGDGLHCMAIKLDGSSKANILYKGVELQVAFEMPVGHLWLHDELATAVRQTLEGVSPEDRKGPALASKTKDGKAGIVVDGEVVYGDLTQSEAEEAVKAMKKAAEQKPLTQDDFALRQAEGGASVLLCGKPLLTIARTEVDSQVPFEQLAAERFFDLIKPFPRIDRPFPGLKRPMRRR